MNNDSREFIIALAGNPNSGKTTLFNNLTGANQHVGNYPGVTVEKKEGYLKYGGYRIKIVDLPGTYSLSSHSAEEIIARNFIIKERPDVVVDIVDASNIERNLYLTTQLLELGTPVIIALNMSDMAQQHGIITDIECLSQLMGVPVVPTVGNKNRGMDELLKVIEEVAVGGSKNPPAQVNYGRELESELERLIGLLGDGPGRIEIYPARWLALKLLENDAEIVKLIEIGSNSSEILEVATEGRQKIETLFNDGITTLIADRRYGFVSGACSEAVKLVEHHRHNISDQIDLVLIHPILGLPIFAVLMWLVFTLTFSVGETPMLWIEAGVKSLAALGNAILPDGLIRSLVVDGIIAGVGGVVAFLPNIMLLFLAIAFLEDSGYMARAAFVMDRIMHKIGLHGKSFIPMLIGFGCSVPAFMGARVLEDKSDRLVTMHVTTFMSCGARLPVYILVGGAFWPHGAGNVVFSIYALGVITAVVTVKVLRTTRFKGMSTPFIMELPPYRVPTIRSLLLHMWERAWLYLRKAGTVILAISIIMWFLMTFPAHKDYSQNYPEMIAQARAAQNDGRLSAPGLESRIASYEHAMAAEKMEYSFAGRLGKFIEPAIKPIGLDWRLGLAAISGFAAKEVVVSTMGTIYGVGDPDADSSSLREKLANDPQYSKLSAYAFMVFVLLYMPCLAALAVFLRETRSWKELLFQMSYTTGLAWLIAFIVFQGGRLLGLG